MVLFEGVRSAIICHFLMFPMGINRYIRSDQRYVVVAHDHMYENR